MYSHPYLLIYIFKNNCLQYLYYSNWQLYFMQLNLIFTPSSIMLSPKYVYSMALVIFISCNALAQDTIKIKRTPYNFSLRQPRANPYKSFDFPLSKAINYSNYPLTADQILRRESQIRGYNRMYNLITNRNKNGFLGNLLGVQRIQKPHADPRF